MFDHSAVARPQTVYAPRSQRDDSLNTQKGDNAQCSKALRLMVT